MSEQAEKTGKMEGMTRPPLWSAPLNYTSGGSIATQRENGE
jgi:hypothetical protein|tara:strand:+ start:60 stop:182 length:123 start_codon:yes stop_codon:yes gene_type:complete